jgi:alpha-L-fucosidase
MTINGRRVVVATILAATAARAAVPIPSSKQLDFMDVGISQFLCFNIDPFATPHVEHNCVSGPPCLSPELFKPSNLSTDEWVETAMAMGSTELVLTVHHEGGFCLWPSNHSNYTVADSPWGGPPRNRDIVAEFVTSCRSRGIKPSFYWGPNANGHLMWQNVTAERFIEVQLAQLRELLTMYGPINRLWWDHYDQGRGKDGRLSPCPPAAFPDGWLAFIEEARRISPDTIICPGPDCTGHLGEAGSGSYPVWYACDAVTCTADNKTDCGCNLSSHGPAGTVFKPLETCSTPYINHQWFANGTGDGQIEWTVESFWASWTTSVGIGYVNTMNSAPGTTGQAQPALSAVQAAFGRVLEPLQLRRALGAVVSRANPPPDAPAAQADPLPTGVQSSSKLTWRSGVSAACSDLEVEVPLSEGATVGAVVTREDLTQGQRIASYAIDFWGADAAWHAFQSCSGGGPPGNNTMTLFPDSNNVFGGPQPGSSTPTITYVGTFDTVEPCQAQCEAAASCHSFTWVGHSGGDFNNQCFLRNDTVWRPHAESPHISGWKGRLPSPQGSNCTHGLSVAAMVVDVLPQTPTTKVRFRCLSSLADPVALRSISAHAFVPPTSSEHQQDVERLR